MALTPEDVLNKTFTQTQFRRGYDEREVDDFLDEIVAEMRRMMKESDELRSGAGRGGAASAVPAAAAVADTRELDALRQSHTDLQAKFDDLRGVLDKERAGRAEAEKRLADGQRTIDDAVRRADAAESRAEAAEARVKELEARLRSTEEWQQARSQAHGAVAGADRDAQARIAEIKKGSPVVSNVQLPEELASLPGIFTTPEQWESQTLIIPHQLRAEKTGEWRQWFSENMTAGN